MSKSIAPGIPYPEFQYHGHTNYTKVYLVLLLLFGISLVVGFFTSHAVAIVLIFITSKIKADLVVGSFMHLKYEPVLIWVAVGLVVFVLLAFFWGIYPDISIVEFEQLKP